MLRVGLSSNFLSNQGDRGELEGVTPYDAPIAFSIPCVIWVWVKAIGAIGAIANSSPFLLRGVCCCEELPIPLYFFRE